MIPNAFLILFLCCLITVAAETLFLFLCGFRSHEEIKIIICANVITNLSMNIILSFVGRVAALSVILEIIVAAAEYLIYAGLFGHSKRLFLLTLAANIISCGLGLLIFG